MSDPTLEEMLLARLKEMVDFYDDRHPNPLVDTDATETAIRRTLTEHAKLKKKVGEWINRSEKVTEKGTEYEAWLLAWDIREYGEEAADE